jgi:RHS repeat-associated protein
LLGSFSYQYDDAGNRVENLSGDPAWVRNANDELVSRGTVNYTYDENGNRTQKNDNGTITNYEYDISDRLVRVADGANITVATYGYDPFGRRLWKETGGSRTYYLYTEVGLAAEYDAAGTELTHYGYWPESRWSQDPLFKKVAGSYYYYLNDHLGTPRLIFDQAGQVVWKARFKPYGEAMVDPASTITNNLRLPGQYFDAETGLHYNNYRFYDSEIGGFISGDPLGIAGGLNLYRYAFNNPINRIDPNGLSVSEDLFGPDFANTPPGLVIDVGADILLCLVSPLDCAVTTGIGVLDFLLDPCAPITDLARAIGPGPAKGLKKPRTVSPKPRPIEFSFSAGKGFGLRGPLPR